MDTAFYHHQRRSEKGISPAGVAWTGKHHALQQAQASGSHDTSSCPTTSTTPSASTDPSKTMTGGDPSAEKKQKSTSRRKRTEKSPGTNTKKRQRVADWAWGPEDEKIKGRPMLPHNPLLNLLHDPQFRRAVAQASIDTDTPLAATATGSQPQPTATLEHTRSLEALSRRKRMWSRVRARDENGLRQYIITDHLPDDEADVFSPTWYDSNHEKGRFGDLGAVSQKLCLDAVPEGVHVKDLQEIARSVHWQLMRRAGRDLPSPTLVASLATVDWNIVARSVSQSRKKRFLAMKVASGGFSNYEDPMSATRCEQLYSLVVATHAKNQRSFASATTGGEHEDTDRDGTNASASGNEYRRR